MTFSVWRRYAITVSASSCGGSGASSLALNASRSAMSSRRREFAHDASANPSSTARRILAILASTRSISVTAVALSA